MLGCLFIVNNKFYLMIIEIYVIFILNVYLNK